ncbi:MAG: hypothetical protein JSW41_03990 [Candidatus Aenigmatarchaeota archaeon]|nr:MAG: hypothetical protein JSW41_03990 [Candidatus Aenigmarchaeota archaeon]
MKLKNRKPIKMVCRVWNCNKLAEYEALKMNGESYAIPYGYCEEHKNIAHSVRRIA